MQVIAIPMSLAFECLHILLNPLFFQGRHVGRLMQSEGLQMAATASQTIKLRALAILKATKVRLNAVRKSLDYGLRARGYVKNSHVECHVGSIHAVPWMGPLDRPKSARKKAPSTGKTDRLENALPIGAEVGHGEASSASSSNAIGQGARQHVERYLQDGDGAPALNAEGRRRDGVALQDSSGSWALERFRSSAGYSEPAVVSAHPSSSLSVTSSVRLSSVCKRHSWLALCRALPKDWGCVLPRICINFHAILPANTRAAYCFGSLWCTRYLGRERLRAELWTRDLYAMIHSCD
jgi:hypothetical protein